MPSITTGTGYSQPSINTLSSPNTSASIPVNGHNVDGTQVSVWYQLSHAQNAPIFFHSPTSSVECMLKPVSTTNSNSHWELYPDVVLRNAGVKTANYRLVTAGSPEHANWVKVSQGYADLSNKDLFIGDYVRGNNLVAEAQPNINASTLAHIFRQLGKLSFMDTLLNNDNRFPLVAGRSNPSSILIDEYADLFVIDHRLAKADKAATVVSFNHRKDNIQRENNDGVNFNAILKWPCFSQKISDYNIEMLRGEYINGFNDGLRAINENYHRIQTATQGINSVPDFPYVRNSNLSAELQHIYHKTEHDLFPELVDQINQLVSQPTEPEASQTYWG